LLAELPDNVSEDSNAQKLGGEIADQLRAAIAMNPLLKSVGEPLDPKTLFEGATGKTRVSVINLAGLASDEARNSFGRPGHANCLFLFVGIVDCSEILGEFRRSSTNSDFIGILCAIGRRDTSKIAHIF
jgi:hypothetical protein